MKKHKGTTNIWKSAQYTKPASKYKLKLHWYFISPQSELLPTRRRMTINAWVDVKEEEPLYTADGPKKTHCGFSREWGKNEF